MQLDKLPYIAVLTLTGAGLGKMESVVDVLSSRPPLINIEQCAHDL